MGYYLRKSFKVGPVRFNLSKSGIGVSAGITGARLGVRPSGQSYVHAGRYGLYYRQELGGKRRAAQPGQSQPESQDETSYGSPLAPTEVYDSADAAQLSTVAGSDLVDLLKESNSWLRLDVVTGLIAAIACIIACFISVVLGLFTTVFGAILTGYVWLWERRRRVVYLHYSLDRQAAAAVEELVGAFNHLASCHRVWALDSSTTLRTLQDFKTHAGASQLVNRQNASLGEGTPPWVVADIPLPTISARGQTLYFLPDGIIVYDRTGIGHVRYHDLQISTDSTRFIESSPPADAQVVDQTWAHPNKSGGPDQRYANNYQIPVCHYGEIVLRSPSGLHLYLQTSRHDAPNVFNSSLGRVVSKIAAARQGTSEQSNTVLSPWVEVNPERFQSLHASMWGTVSGGLDSMAQLALVTDAFLGKISGEGNSIIYNFLRVVSIGTVLIVLLFGLYLSLAAITGQ